MGLIPGGEVLEADVTRAGVARADALQRGALRSSRSGRYVYKLTYTSAEETTGDAAGGKHLEVNVVALVYGNEADRAGHGNQLGILVTRAGKVYGPPE